MTLPTRPELEASRGEVLAPGSSLRPRVLLVRGETASLVVKDVRHTLGPLRPLARTLLRREERVLERLAGVAGVPRLLGRIDGDAIAMSLEPGRPLSRESAAEAPADFFERLEALVAEIHARGVVHLDLRQKRNVLVGADGRPRVVDFGAALAPPPPIAGWLRAVDRSAAVKFRLKYRPESVDPRERERHRRFERLRRFWIVSPMRRNRPGANLPRTDVGDPPPPVVDRRRRAPSDVTVSPASVVASGGIPRTGLGAARAECPPGKEKAAEGTNTAAEARPRRSERTT